MGHKVAISGFTIFLDKKLARVFLLTIQRLKEHRARMIPENQPLLRVRDEGFV